jgi:hypothetical protein
MKKSERKKDNKSQARKAIVLSGAALLLTSMAYGQRAPEPGENRIVPAITSSSSLAKPQDADQSELNGYDFGHVVETLQSSVDPLQRELDASFMVFIDRVDQAVTLLDAGQTREAVAMSTVAIEGVLQVRDTVLEPMWDGQIYLTEQISKVRSRLASAVSAGTNPVGDESSAHDPATEAVLDGIAKRISQEQDALRRKRLVAHYRTVRDLAQIKRTAQRMSPDQRKLWVGVLRVLEEAALAHQQVLMGSEILYTQFESTAGHLQEYLVLLDTVDGATELLGVINGIEGAGQGMTSFATSMQELQARLSTFNGAVQEALQTSMFELEAKVDSLPIYSSLDAEMTGIAPTQLDAELADRLSRIEGSN